MEMNFYTSVRKMQTKDEELNKLASILTLLAQIRSLACQSNLKSDEDPFIGALRSQIK
jgi:head-tail adaptor